MDNKLSVLMQFGNINQFIKELAINYLFTLWLFIGTPLLFIFFQDSSFAVFLFLNSLLIPALIITFDNPDEKLNTTKFYTFLQIYIFIGCHIFNIYFDLLKPFLPFFIFSIFVISLFCYTQKISFANKFSFIRYVFYTQFIRIIHKSKNDISQDIILPLIKNLKLNHIYSLMLQTNNENEKVFFQAMVLHIQNNINNFSIKELKLVEYLNRNGFYTLHETNSQTDTNYPYLSEINDFKNKLISNKIDMFT